METLAYRIAKSIKNSNPEETHSIEVMQYSLGILLNTLLIFFISGIIGFITGRLEETILVFFSLSLLRMLSGGFHLKTANACNIFSIALCTIIPHLSIYFVNINWLTTGLSLILISLFAPNPDPNVQIPRRLFPALKVLSILIVTSNFLISSPVIGLVFLVQSLTIIPLQRRVL